MRLEQGPEDDTELCSHREESGFCPEDVWKPVEVWVPEVTNPPFPFILIHGKTPDDGLSDLEPMFLPPSYCFFFFSFSFWEAWDPLNILLTSGHSLHEEPPHTDTRPIWPIISGVSVAQPQSFWSSLSSPCYKRAPWGPDGRHFWEGLSWVNRSGCTWILKWEADGPVGRVCPHRLSHLTPGPSFLFLSKGNFSFKVWSQWY